MPNWAYGHTDITGTKTAILSFVKRYIFPDESKTIDGVKYFARSFLHVDREEIKAEIEEAFRGVPQDEEREFRIYPDYAWSASTCVESGYLSIGRIPALRSRMPAWKTKSMSLSTPRKKECGLRSIFGVSGLVSLARNPVI